LDTPNGEPFRTAGAGSYTGLTSGGFRALQQLQGAAYTEEAAVNLRHCTGEEFAVNMGDLWTLNYTKTLDP